MSNPSLDLSLPVLDSMTLVGMQLQNFAIPNGPKWCDFALVLLGAHRTATHLDRSEEVTQLRQYEKVPNIYINGDEFVSGFLGLDWAPSASAKRQKADYEDGVARILDGLIKTMAGWSVLTDVFFAPTRKMIIQPYHPTPSGGQFNATAGATDGVAATMKDTEVAGWQGYANVVQNSAVVTGSDFFQGFKIKLTGKRGGRPYSMTYKYKCNSKTQITLTAFSSSFRDDPTGVAWDGDSGSVSWIIQGGDPSSPPERGTGVGSNTILRYSPSTFSAPGAPTGPGAAPDEILLHEMVHGLRQMMGRAVFEEVKGNPGMDNYEEFAAIVISNIYRSERGVGQLRQDHHGFAPLTGPEATAAGFKSAYPEYLNNMGIEQPRLVSNLKKATCAFNPFV